MAASLGRLPMSVCHCGRFELVSFLVSSFLLVQKFLILCLCTCIYYVAVDIYYCFNELALKAIGKMPAAEQNGVMSIFLKE